MTADIGRALAAQAARLRAERGLSLDALAEAAGLSKGTVVAIERGAANPSVGVLVRLAAAFGVSVTDLLGEAPTGQGVEAERMRPQALWSGPAGGEGRLEASSSGALMFELWTWVLAPGERHVSDAHRPGTQELVKVESGALRVTCGDADLVLRAGEAARLTTDRPHAYAAEGEGPVRFTMAVLERGGAQEIPAEPG